MSGGVEKPATDAPQGASAPAFAPEQELRLAVVLYGGVSLAIYMYGVVQELYNLVRATAPSRSYAGDAEPPPDLAFGETPSTDAVYRALGQLLPLDDGARAAAGVGGPVRTRFVVDIVSGTSAGGINGICLAKALANEAQLDQLKQVWLKEGDIAALINDEQSGFYEPPPGSLLSGRRMLDRLVKAMKAMEAGHDGASRLVDELDLWVTATDLEGLEVPIQIANATPTERRHANRYHFRYAAADGVNDLDASTDAFVAYAARSTSAFPFAFEPVLLEDLEGLAEMPADAWSRFYSAYASTPPPPFGRRAFSDGGILDNKPFSYATDTLVGRHASLPVERKVIYVEPAPEGSATRPPRERWNAIDTTQAALLGLPHVENIRGDVQAVLARNRSIERVRDLVSRLGSGPDEQAALRDLASQPTSDDWRTLAVSDALSRRAWGPGYGVYHGLKVRGVVDYLAALIVRAAGFDPESDEAFAAHYLVRAWKEARYAPQAGGGKESENAFLQDFDVPYRLRRLDFVLRRNKELLGHDPDEVRRVVEICGADPDAVPATPGFEEVLTHTLRELGDVRAELARAEGRLVARDRGLAAQLARLGLGRDQLRTVLADPADSAMLKAAEDLLGAHSLDGVAELIKASLADALEHAREGVEAQLGPPVSALSKRTRADGQAAVRRALRFSYDTFEAYDLPLYMLQFGTPIGETNPVDVVRISPEEANGPQGARRDLKGLRLHHFGAFLDESWRRNDMVWGRLDGAECLIRALLPPANEKVEELVRDAHRRILEEYREELGAGGDGEVWEWFTAHQVEQDPPRERTTEALNRGAVAMVDLAGSVMPPRAGASPSVQTALGGMRKALLDHDDAQAASAVTGIATRHRLMRWAAAVWLLGFALGIVLFVLGDGWRLAGCFLLGVTFALGALAGVAWIGVRVAIRKALAAARRAVYALFFSGEGGGAGRS